MMRRAIAALALLASCRTHPAVLPSRDAAEMSNASGSVAARLLEDPSAPGVQLGPGEEYVPAQLMSPTAKPQYPAGLLTAALPLHVVTLRVTFDERGRAAEVGASPLGPTTQDQYTEDFVRAATDALKQWTCYPAQIRKFRPGPDEDGDGKPDYRILAASKVLRTYFDVSFSFEVVNGQPVVKRTR